MTASDGFRAFKLKVTFYVRGTDFEVADDLRRTKEPIDDEEADRKACEDEVAGLIAPYFAILNRIGCINAGDANGYFLIVDGPWKCPEEPLPWASEVETAAQLARDVERALVCHVGASVSISVLVDQIGLDEVFRALSGMVPYHPVDEWGGERTVDRLPRDGEALQEWAARAALSLDDMNCLSERLVRFGFNLPAAAAFPFGSAKTRAEWVMKGVVPLADITSLVAQPGIGKTSLAHYLLAAASAPESDGIEKTFLGQPICGEFHAALFNGEETSDYEFIRRQKQAEHNWSGSNRIIRPHLTRATFSSELDAIAQLAMSLPNGRRGILVIDSAQAFLEGDDTKAHVAAEFYRLIREFALETGWAVLLIHHTNKSPARSFANFRDSVRGSSVHVQMPRNVLGMIPRGAGLVGFGTVKCNISPDEAWLREGDEVLIRRNSETGIFELFEQNADGSSQASGHGIDRVASAIGEMNRLGRVVHKSGTHGLFEQRLPILVGLSRSFIQQAIAALIECSRICATKDGLFLNETDGDQQSAMVS